MRAVGYKIPLPIADDQSMVDIEVSKPSVSGRDLLVGIKAVAVNPVWKRLFPRRELRRMGLRPSHPRL